ncbi:hypothetical protein TNCV_2984181, partial [Trichonephila clavipes]
MLGKWSATSCGTVVVLLLRAERARKRSSAGVVARGRPETGLSGHRIFGL